MLFALGIHGQYVFVDRRNQLVIVMMSSQADPLDAELISLTNDLLVSRDGKQPYAVLSIGGFLGMGTRLVVVPYDTPKFSDNKVMLPGGTKEGLKMLLEFKYAAG